MCSCVAHQRYKFFFRNHWIEPTTSKTAFIFSLLAFRKQRHLLLPECTPFFTFVILNKTIVQRSATSSIKTEVIHLLVKYVTKGVFPHTLCSKWTLQNETTNCPLSVQVTCFERCVQGIFLMMKIIDYYLKNSSPFNLYKVLRFSSNQIYLISHSLFFTKYLLCIAAIDNE